MRINITTHNLHFHESSPIYAIDSLDKILVTAGGDAAIRVWEVAAGNPPKLEFEHNNALTASTKIKYVETLSGHTLPVNTVRFGNGWLASGGDDGQIIAWNANSLKGKGVIVRGFDRDEVTEIAWGKNVLFAGHRTGKISVFNMGGKDLSKIHETSPPVNVINSDDHARESNEAINEKRVKAKRVPVRKISTLFNFKHSIRAVSDIVQGMTYDEEDSVLFVISRDKRLRAFRYDGSRLSTICTMTIGGVNRIIGDCSALFKRMVVINRRLYVPCCAIDGERVVLVYAHPYKDAYCKVGQFDSHIVRTINYKKWIVFLSGRDVHVLSEEMKPVVGIHNAVLRTVTDATEVGGILMISSLDGFVSSVWIEDR